MSLLDRYQSSTLGIVANYGEEPMRRQEVFGFYSRNAGQSSSAINNFDSRLHNEYSLNDDPSDLNCFAYNPEAWWGFPYETLLDPLDQFSPKNPRAINYNIDQNYRNSGPSEGRY